MTRRKVQPVVPAVPVGVHEAKVEAALLAADVLAYLCDPLRTRQRMAGRRPASEVAAVVLVASAVQELVRGELDERRSRGLPDGDALMLSRRLLTELVARSFRSGS